MKGRPEFPSQLVEVIARGEAVAVIGSGISIACGLPSWSGLLDLLISECCKQIPSFTYETELRGLLKRGYFLEVADACCKALDGSSYRDFIQRTFNVPSKNKSPLHKSILRLPFSSILTTNYDTLIEREYLRDNLAARGMPVYTHRNIAHLSQVNSPRGFYVFKLHGHVDDVESVILSRRDYRNLMHANPAFRMAISNIIASKSLVFIGYGLRDPDLNLLLEEHATVFRGFGRRHFAFLADPGEVLSASLSDNYNVTAIPYSSDEGHARLPQLLTALNRQVEEARERIDLQDIERRSEKIPAMQQVREVMQYERRICEYLGSNIELERARFLHLHADGAGFSASDKALIKKSIELGEVTKRELVALQEQLIQATRLETIGTLSGGIAHDFNNLLSMITMGNELSLSELNNPEQLRANMLQIRAACERGGQLIRQILTFSRQGRETSRASIDLGVVITESIVFLKKTLPENVQINWVPPEKGFVVYADQTQMHQLMANVLINAAQAIDANPGRIDIDLTIADGRYTPALTVFDGRRYCMVSIKDTGCGIDAKAISRVFDPFFTTKQKGTGLGLAVVHGIVRSHDGEVIVESKLGEGAIFRIYLPLSESKTEESSEKVDNVLKINGETVFIVDDDKNIVALVARTLQNYGYKTVAFDDPQMALDAVLSGTNKCDLVLSDLTMPKLSGLDIARAMKRNRIIAPVIVFTGYAFDLAKAKRAGVVSVVHKPFKPPVLVSEIARAIEKSKRSVRA